MISLLMLSGGIDSAYALVKLLRETDDEVIVHHIHLVTNLGRHIPEASSCQQIVDYCRKNFRSFYYTESAVDRRRYLVHGFDLLTAGFEAGVIAASYRIAHRREKKIDRWIVGIAADDQVPDLRLDDAARLCKMNCTVGEAPKLFIFPRVDLVEQVEYLPEDLFNLTWSCRRPLGLPRSPAACGQCSSCTRRAKAERHLAARTFVTNRMTAVGS